MPEQFASWDPSEDQERAYKGVMGWVSLKPESIPVVTIGGYAGTGKTSLVGQIARDLRSHGKRVAFATYTGKAAQVLARSLKAARVSPDYVGTIHGLIYTPDVNEKTGRVRGWIRNASLPFNLLVIDEASMVPKPVLDDLLAYKIPILAVGDHGQLPPVGEDSGLMRDPDFRLEKIHRQAEGNPIIELSRMAREGSTVRELREFAEADTTGKLFVSDCATDALSFSGQDGFAIGFTNRLRTSLNKIARKRLGYEGDPKPGETVICVKNAKLASGMLANGARMVLRSVEEHDAHRFYVEADTDDRPVSFLASRYQFGRPTTFKGFDEIEKIARKRFYSWDDVGVLLDYGYALTCHKSQGSQAPNVSVVCEGALRVLKPDERKRWFYTAITRASDRLLLTAEA